MGFFRHIVSRQKDIAQPAKVDVKEKDDSEPMQEKPSPVETPVTAGNRQGNLLDSGRPLNARYHAKTADEQSEHTGPGTVAATKTARSEGDRRLLGAIISAGNVGVHEKNSEAEGRGYGPAMGTYLEKGRHEVNSSVTEDEMIRRSREIGNYTLLTAQQNLPVVSETIERGDTDGLRIENWRNAKGDEGVKAIDAARNMQGENVRESGDNFRRGAEVTAKAYEINLKNGQLYFGDIIEKMTGQRLHISRDHLIDVIARDRKTLEAMQGKLIPYENVYVAGDPGQSLKNFQKYAYQSVFGRYAFDAAIAYLTSPMPTRLGYIVEIFNIAADIHAREASESSSNDILMSLRKTNERGHEREYKFMLKRLADRLDPASAQVMHFLIDNLKLQQEAEILIKVRDEQKKEQKNKKAMR